MSLSSPIYTAWSNPYAIKNLPVNTKKGAGDYLYMGKPIQSSPAQSRPAQSRPVQSRPVQSRPAGSASLVGSASLGGSASLVSLVSLEKPLIYMANNPYIQREESTTNLLEHLGAYQLIEKHFTLRA